MCFTEQDGLRYYTFDSLAGYPLRHALLTRRGGVSAPPWASLNLGGTVGDDPLHVRQNRQRAFQALGVSGESVFDVWQVHSAEVVATARPRPADEAHRKADAILTDQPGVTLFMRFADCVPILLYDPTRQVIGLVHAGWIGTVDRVVSRAVQEMAQVYGVDPGNILAGIGPSIAAHHYEVGPEVQARVRQVFGADSASLLQALNGNEKARPEAPEKVTFDLWAANRLLLNQAGVEQVEIAGICTACHLEDWYSHRGEQGKTGRFGALIRLEG